ncbi:MAG: hypothetical protein Q9170_003753 [Blastenia crenularia]
MSSTTNMNPFTNKAYSGNYFVLREKAKTLPVSQRIPQLLSSIKQSNVVVLVGETGSGKTTQLPKAMLLDDELNKSGKKLALTQNRVLAAQLTAQRIAEEMDVEVGGVVGLKHRGRDSTISKTRLEVITDGSLVVAARNDPCLQAYGAIVIDDAHQHSVATDLLLGLLKELSVKRKDDLKIIVMSATIDAALFLDFFPGSILETVGGREHQVLVSYLPEPPEEDTIVEVILQVHLTGQPGNILAFVSGVPEMFRIMDKIYKALNGPERRFAPNEIGPLHCLPLHARLSPDAQDDAVESVAPAPQQGKIGRKLLVATNIAETSVTLTGVAHVIDSCKFKSKIWNPQDESWCLREQWVSKAVARQRAGRAGRTKEGMAYRMCTQGGFHEQLLEHSVPAIKEGDMLSECLDILMMGRSPLTFPYIAAPASETIVKALSILFQLGAVDLKGGLTDRGKAIARLPINVYSAVVLLGSPKFGCSDEILSLVSMIEASDNGSDVFIKPSSKEEATRIMAIRNEFCHKSGDHITLFNIYMSWRQACNATANANAKEDFVRSNKLNGSVLRSADQTRLQLLRMLSNDETWKLMFQDPNKPGYYLHMLKALAAGSYLHVAKREHQSEARKYMTVRHGARVRLMAETDLGNPSRNNEWVIYNEYHSDGLSKKTIRLVSAIVPEILIATQSTYWSDLEFLPKGHIQDSLVKVIAKMTGKSEDFVRGGIPKKPQ